MLVEIWTNHDLLDPVTCLAVMHVKGHQDRNMAYERLAIPAQLNVDADKMRGGYLAAHPDEEHSVVHTLPTSGIQLNLAVGTIAYNIKQKLIMARTSEPMKQHMIDKHHWDEDTFNDVEWEAHRRATNQHHYTSEELH